MAFEGPSAVSVRDPLFEGGAMPEMELLLATPLPELVARVGEFPTVF